MKIGLTGKSCAGKNEVAKILEEKGFVIIDLDVLGHEAIKANNDLLISVFGEGIATDGIVDRKKLGPVVFSSPDGLRKLESISHPWMIRKAKEMAETAEKEGKDAVFNAAILHRLTLDRESDAVIFVDAPYGTREKRAIERDGITAEKFRARNASQGDVTLEGDRVFTLINDSGRDNLCRQVESTCAKIQKYRG